MAMNPKSTPLDKVQMLISLALNNPNEEEARSAAIKAVSLIVQCNMSIEGNTAGANVDPSKIKKAWRPDEEFDTFWDQVVRDAKGGNEGFRGFQSQEDMDRNPWENQTSRSQGYEGVASTQVDTDLDPDFMRTRTKIAWRAIQRERARLKTWIYEIEQRYGRKYPRPEPADWEKLND